MKRKQTPSLHIAHPKVMPLSKKIPVEQLREATAHIDSILFRIDPAGLYEGETLEVHYRDARGWAKKLNRVKEILNQPTRGK